METIEIRNAKGNKATTLQVFTAEMYKEIAPILQKFAEAESLEIGGVVFEKDEATSKRIETMIGKFEDSWKAKVGKAKVKTIVEFID